MYSLRFLSLKARLDDHLNISVVPGYTSGIHLILRPGFVVPKLFHWSSRQ